MAQDDVLTTPPPPPSRAGKEARTGVLRRLRLLPKRLPLRTKLVAAVLGLVILALLAISIASVYMLRSYVTSQRDTQIESVFNDLEQHPQTVQNEVTPGHATTIQAGMVLGLQQPGHQLTWMSYDGAGGRSFTLSGPLPSLPTSADWASTTDAVLLTTPSQSKADTWRVLAVRVTDWAPSITSTQTEPVTVVLAVDLGDINALTTRLILFDLIVGGAIVVVLAAVGIAAVQSNLRPLNDIEMTAGQIALGHLDHRVPEGDPRTEIGSLGRSLNKMLSQIETAFHDREASEQAAHDSEERMRRFVADASHELRTPLTTIRGFAAHYRQRGGVSGEQIPPEDIDHLMSRVESEATRMGLLVEDLLTLARLDQQRPLAKAPVDLLTVAADAVQDARIVSPDRPIELVVAPGTAFLVEGDEPRLRQVLSNLVNNALTHTPAGTPVRVKIGRGTLEPGQPAGRAEATPAAVLDVEDDGQGMTTEQARRVFERFYRADAARNRASGGTGLGLAIVAGLVNAHGGTVSVRTEPGHGADFQVKLPLSPDVLADDDEADEADDIAEEMPAAEDRPAVAEDTAAPPPEDSPPAS